MEEFENFLFDCLHLIETGNAFEKRDGRLIEGSVIVFLMTLFHFDKKEDLKKLASDVYY